MSEVVNEAPQQEAQPSKIFGEWKPFDLGDGREPYSPNVVQEASPAVQESTPAPAPAAAAPTTQADLVPNTTEAAATQTGTPPASAAQTTDAQPATQPINLEQLGVTPDYVEAYKDESFKEFFEAYKAGKLPEYLADRTTDYNKVSDESLVRSQIARKYQNIDDLELRQKAIEREFAKNYPLSGDEDEDKDVLESMKIDAAIERSQLVKEQAQRKGIPSLDQSKAQEEQRKAAELEMTKQIESYLSQPAVKQFETSRTAMIGEGEEAFKIEVPQNVDLRNVLSRPDQHFFPLFVKPDGAWDDTKWHTIVAIASNYDNFRKAVADHYKAIGEKSEFLKSRNIPSAQDGNTPPPSTKERILGDFIPYNR